MATSFVLGRSFTSTYTATYASASELSAALPLDHFEKLLEKPPEAFLSTSNPNQTHR